jgi:hypothetical protein
MNLLLDLVALEVEGHRPPVGPVIRMPPTSAYRRSGPIGLEGRTSVVAVAVGGDVVTVASWLLIPTVR